MEPNPYEAPKADEPPKPARLVKRGLGVAAIVGLTPVAVGIAGFVSCQAAIGYWRIAAPLPVFASIAIAFGPPIAVLYYMVKWAIATHQRNVPPTKR